DSLLAESVRIHQRLLQRQKWTADLANSLSGLAENQKNLGDETSRMAADKFAEAKVFTHLLSKAAEMMKSASGQIHDRHEQAKDFLAEVAAKRNPSLDVAAENLSNAEIMQSQQTALRRLDQLLVPLKQENGKLMSAKSQGQGGGGGGGGGQRAGDGDNIPPLAQLKALKSLEQEI